ncbi:MAG TPA: helix-turn-helix domain-containing protein [Acetobacteraceae bacterium]|nr:helix-turn-helix domain-containing protein [Acetobacteraceae bacterium]
MKLRGDQADSLGLSPSQTKALNRTLIEAGVVTMKDSPNGKRYGLPDRTGQITEAYGFDLAPIATRHAEFVRLAEEARVERAEMGRLRRRATIARKGIVQILETAAEYHLDGEDWASLARETRILANALKKVERTEEMVLGVESLERRQRSARECLENLLSQAMAGPSEKVDSPLGAGKPAPPEYLQPNPESADGYGICQRGV